MNKELWGILDPEGKYKHIYNQYAHMIVEITNKPSTEVTLISGDQIKLQLDAELLPEIGVKYVLSNKDLLQFNGENVSFKRIFSQGEGQYSIYQVD